MCNMCTISFNGGSTLQAKNIPYFFALAAYYSDHTTASSLLYFILFLTGNQ